MTSVIDCIEHQARRIQVEESKRLKNITGWAKKFNALIEGSNSKNR